MDELQASTGPRWSAPQEARQITRPRIDHHAAADRPFRELTIRDLIVELGKVEEALAHGQDADRPKDTERYMTQREKLIIAELHRRHSLDPASQLRPASDDGAEASSS